MAIKGKGKTKAGRRAVTRGPKPGYVEPPKPLFRQTWFRWTALGVLVAGIAAIVLSIVLITSANNDKKAKAKELHDKQGAIQQYVGPITQYLQPVAQPLGGGTLVAAFQDLPTQLADLKSGKLSEDDALGIGKNMVTDAGGAAGNIEGLKVASLVDTARFPDLVDLLDSQELLATSMRLYQQIGRDIVSAASATGVTQKEPFIRDAETLQPIAAKLFNDGYQKLINAETSNGMQPNLFPAPGPTPTPTAPPTTAPVPSPSASASPEPSASASPKASQSPKPKPKPSASGKGGNGGGKGGKGSAKPSPTAS